MWAHSFTTESEFKPQTRWNSTDLHWKLCLRLLWPWPFDLMSTSQAQVHTWPNFGENVYKDCLWCLWHLIPKANQHIYKPKYTCDQNWVKFPSLGCEIRCSQGCGVKFLACCDLGIWPFDLISMSQALIHKLILVKWAQIFTKILYSPGFSGHCLLWPWPLTFDLKS